MVTATAVAALDLKGLVVDVSAFAWRQGLGGRSRGGCTLLPVFVSDGGLGGLSRRQLLA